MIRIILIILLILSLICYLGSKANKKKNTEYGARNASQKNLTRHDIYDSIEKLAELRNKGLITEEEFIIEKKKLLNQ